jgi:hypothetical protein
MGRKPQGLGRKGEPQRIRDYPKLLVTIRPSVKRKLKRMAAEERRPMWKVIDDAIHLYEQNYHRKQRPSPDESRSNLLRVANGELAATGFWHAFVASIARAGSSPWRRVFGRLVAPGTMAFAEVLARPRWSARDETPIWTLPALRAVL